MFSAFSLNSNANNPATSFDKFINDLYNVDTDINNPTAGSSTGLKALQANEFLQDTLSKVLSETEDENEKSSLTRNIKHSMWKLVPQMLYGIKGSDEESILVAVADTLTTIIIRKQENDGSDTICEQLCMEDDPCLKMLLTLLQSEEAQSKSMFRIEALNFLKTLSTSREKSYLIPIRRKLVSIPLSLQILISMLDDREEVRFSLLALLKTLTEKLPSQEIDDNDLENFIAFSEGLPKLCEVILQEIKLDSMVSDCLEIIRNVIWNNKTALKMFLQSAENLKTILRVLELPSVSIENDKGQNVHFVDIDGVSQTKLTNILIVIETFSLVFNVTSEQLKIMCRKSSFVKDSVDNYESNGDILLNKRIKVSIRDELKSLLTPQLINSLMDAFGALLVSLPESESTTNHPAQTNFTTIRKATTKFFAFLLLSSPFQDQLITNLFSKMYKVSSNSEMYSFCTSELMYSNESTDDLFFEMELPAALLFHASFNHCRLSNFLCTLWFISDLNGINNNVQFSALCGDFKQNEGLFVKTNFIRVSFRDCLFRMFSQTLLEENTSLDTMKISWDVFFILSIAICGNNDVKQVLQTKKLNNQVDCNLTTFADKLLEIACFRFKVLDSSQSLEGSLSQLSLTVVCSIVYEFSSNLLFCEKLINHPTIIHLVDILRVPSSNTDDSNWTTGFLRGLCAATMAKIFFCFHENKKESTEQQLLKLGDEVITIDRLMLPLENLSNYPSFSNCGKSKQVMARERVPFHLGQALDAKSGKLDINLVTLPFSMFMLLQEEIPKFKAYLVDSFCRTEKADQQPGATSNDLDATILLQDNQELHEELAKMKMVFERLQTSQNQAEINVSQEANPNVSSVQDYLVFKNFSHLLSKKLELDVVEKITLIKSGLRLVRVFESIPRHAVSTNFLAEFLINIIQLQSQITYPWSEGDKEEINNILIEIINEALIEKNLDVLRKLGALEHLFHDINSEAMEKLLKAKYLVQNSSLDSSNPAETELLQVAILEEMIVELGGSEALSRARSRVKQLCDSN